MHQLHRVEFLLSDFFVYCCSILTLRYNKTKPHKKTTNQPNKKKSQELSRNKTKKNLKKNIPCSLHLFNKLFVLFCFLAFPAIKQIYTLIYTAHQQRWLQQFCAAGMKRQTHPPYTRPSKSQPTNQHSSLLLSMIFLTVP